jgi:asparagine synthase (glutamine-hydrolysing)
MEGILPKKIQSRNSKLAFATPEEIWVRNEQPEKFRQLLRKAVEQSKGIISPQAIAMGDNIISGKQPFNFQLWRIICFGEWMEKFSVTT